MSLRSTDEDSSGDDPDDALLAELLGEIDGGTLTLDSAIERHPRLERRLREMESLRRVLWTTQSSVAQDVPSSLGEFRIDGVIGQGGMGVVYRAYHERLQRDVAVKAIRPARVSPSAVERFLREQTALARLHQTCIVPIYAAGSDGSIDYFVMPHIEGVTLHEALDHLRRVPTPDMDSLFSAVESMRRHSHETKEAPATGQTAVGEGSKSTEPPSSQAFWKSVAAVIAEAAEAIEHAHRRHVFHRDLKPSNIMLTAEGRMWIIDFGLAAFLPSEADEPFDPALARRDGLTNAAVGTWSYMAPEQFQRIADARTDVWGLGVTLYEMLTLRRAFAHRSTTELKHAIEAESPPHPCGVFPLIPADLAAICWKAMSKRPDDRYQTAAALAADLRRFLREDEVSARPRPLAERARHWVSMHWALTAFIVTLGVAVPTIIAVQYHANVKARSEIAEQRRQVILGDLDSVFQSNKFVGWSDRALRIVKEAGTIRKDAALRDAAVAAFTGPDFQLKQRIFEYGASSAAYDANGKRLALGGTEKRGERPPSPAKIWNLDEPAPIFGKAEGAGLVAFQGDGSAVQLTANATGETKVARILSGEVLRTLRGLEGRTRKDVPNLAISANGDVAAASFPDEDLTLLWGGDGRAHRIPSGATALALSRDGTLLGIGTRNGEVSVWSVAHGRRLATHSLSRNTVKTLAFNRSATLRGERIDGRIAAGWFGRYAVVDLAVSRVQCLFESEEIVSKRLEFGPGDTTLVADDALFDAATGNRLLTIGGNLEVFAFSPDGREACQASAVGFSEPQVVRVAITQSRGVALLHGLKTPAVKFAFSRQGGTMAALSLDWTLAVWRVDSETLVRTFDVPEGPFADNAAVALSHDGSMVAAASGKLVCQWNVATGERIRQWELPPGISNGLAFRPNGDLIVARTELHSMSDYPLTPLRYPEHPRTQRVRNLSSAAPTKPVCEIRDFPRHSFGTILSGDGERVFIDGLAADGARRVRLYEAGTGKELASIPVGHQRDFHSLRADPTGAAVSFQSEVEPYPGCTAILNARDGTQASRCTQEIVALGPNGMGRLAHGFERISGIYLQSLQDPAFRLTKFGGISVAEFSPDGCRIAFETGSGAVGLVELPVIERFLDDLGLHW